jgi:hypothetical protein
MFQKYYHNGRTNSVTPTMTKSPNAVIISAASDGEKYWKAFMLIKTKTSSKQFLGANTNICYLATDFEFIYEYVSNFDPNFLHASRYRKRSKT